LEVSLVLILYKLFTVSLLLKLINKSKFKKLYIINVKINIVIVIIAIFMEKLNISFDASEVI